jgi:hypothetical protein
VGWLDLVHSSPAHVLVLESQPQHLSVLNCRAQPDTAVTRTAQTPSLHRNTTFRHPAITQRYDRKLTGPYYKPWQLKRQVILRGYCK